MLNQASSLPPQLLRYAQLYWVDAMYHTVAISFLRSIKSTESGRKAWSVRIRINDNEPFDVDAFHDPFHKGEYDHFQWYLERCSIEKHAASKKKDDFEREKVENIVKEKEARSISEIRRYGRELFKQL